MSLYQQISMLISGIFLVLFGIVLSVSFGVVSTNAQKSLYENAQNSASSISLSIQNGGINPSSIQTVINAAFDNGNYEKILFKDTDGTIKYSKTKQKDNPLVPEWFDSLIMIDTAPSFSTISSGWLILGVVEVHSDTDLFKKQLYEIFWKLLVYLGIAYVVALVSLYLFLRLLLKPLKRIKEQAHAIMENKFLINEKIPKTHEFRSVIKSMNTMTKKVKQIYENANEALRHNSELLYIDTVTKLHNRRFFALKADEYLSTQSALSSGSLVVVGLKRADLLNRIIGYKSTDEFFQKLSENLKEFFGSNPENLIIRLNGTEFAVMLPNTQSEDIVNGVHLLSKALHVEFKSLQIDEEDIDLYIGLCPYENERNVTELFSKIDYTLLNAKLESSQKVLHVKHSAPIKTKTQWREIFKEAIEKEQFNIKYNPVYNIESGEILVESANFSLNIDNQNYPYNSFIAPLVELRFVDAFYDYALKTILNSTPKDVPISITLPLQFMQSDDTLQMLEKVFSQSANSGKNSIIFEIPESAFVDKSDGLLRFINSLECHSCSFAIRNFIAAVDDFDYLRELKPAYIKSSKSFIFDNAQNMNLVNILMESLGFNLIVTQIQSEDEIENLKELKVNFYTRILQW